MTAHADLVDSELHENKGVDGAAADEVATADGAGGTVWKKIEEANIDAASVFNVNKAYLTTIFADIDTSGTQYVLIPFTGTLTKIDTVLGAAISGSDNTMTFKNNAGTSMGTITVTQSGSAPGDIDTLSPGSNNTFIAGQKLAIETNGSSTGAAKLYITLTFTITG